jgi:GAF domain-containing protein
MVELADTLTEDFDVVELLNLLVERSVELLDASAAGLMLGDKAGSLQHMVSTSQGSELLELVQVEEQRGPCIECYRKGEPVISNDLSEARHLWPTFAPAAMEAGFQAAHSFPLRLRGRVLGSLNLFSSDRGGLTPADVVAGQALADVAAIALCQFWALRDERVVTEQLQHALESRVVIEQAKGMLAERASVGVDEAFSFLRGYARTTKRRLVDVAGEVVAGALDADVVVSGPSAGRRAASEGRRAG